MGIIVVPLCTSICIVIRIEVKVWEGVMFVAVEEF